TASGAFALTENSLYTIEAVEDYLDHLAPGGVVTFTRWHNLAFMGPETARLLVLAAAALEHRGVEPGKARQHMYFVAANDLGTLLVKREPFTAVEISRLDQAAQAARFNVLLSP